MSTNTRSADTAITVPSSCLRPSSRFRECACSYSERRSLKDSFDSVLVIVFVIPIRESSEGEEPLPYHRCPGAKSREDSRHTFRQHQHAVAHAMSLGFSLQKLQR